MDNIPTNKYQTEGEKAVQQEKQYEEILQSLRSCLKTIDHNSYGR